MRVRHQACAPPALISYRAAWALVALGSAGCAAAAGSLPPRMGVMQKVAFQSQALSETRWIYVYTPPGYLPVGTTSYPVVFMLHGSPGEASDWITKGRIQGVLDAAIGSGALPPCIAVLANGKGPYYKTGSEWADSTDGRCRMETSIAVDLPRFILSRYRAAPDPAFWALCGVSEGAYGACNLLVRHTDRFRSALALSGEYEVSDAWPDASDVFGDNRIYWRQNSPLQQLERVSPVVRKELHFCIVVGDEDAQSLSQSVAFAGLCGRLGVTARLVRAPGKHGWVVWNPRLPEALAALGGWWKDLQR
ncbi:MAG: alpha/beta hydrolase-fold protein [Armatimonadetes bacterium]|nr:alpha/beta hydrolase-fold protein [Armatimonadota bacterium]